MSQHQRTLSLRSGGSITLSGDIDLFAASAEDLQFVFGLVDRLDEYETGDEDAEVGAEEEVEDQEEPDDPEPVEDAPALPKGPGRRKAILQVLRSWVASKGLTQTEIENTVLELTGARIPYSAVHYELSKLVKEHLVTRARDPKSDGAPFRYELVRSKRSPGERKAAIEEARETARSWGDRQKSRIGDVT